VSYSSESESELFYDWRFSANKFVLTPNPLRLTAGILSFHLNTCGHSPYITSSLTRRFVCHLQLLLALDSAFILGSESRRTHDHISLSQIRDSPTWNPGPRIYIPQEQGGPVTPPGTRSPFRRFLRLAGLRWR
jgi:hypothetical protein